jgi:hypothetical protein
MAKPKNHVIAGHEAMTRGESIASSLILKCCFDLIFCSAKLFVGKA